MYWWKQWKIKTFSVPIKKEVAKIDKDANKSVQPISCKIKFIDSMRFMATISKLVDNLAEGLHKIKCKECGCSLEYESVNDTSNKISIFVLFCDKYHLKKLDEDLKMKFKTTFKFSNNEWFNEFILLLRKGVCPYEYMDDWDKFNITWLLDKKDFYSELIISRKYY